MKNKKKKIYIILSLTFVPIIATFGTLSILYEYSDLFSINDILRGVFFGSTAIFLIIYLFLMQYNSGLDSREERKKLIKKFDYNAEIYHLEEEFLSVDKYYISFTEKGLLIVEKLGDFKYKRKNSVGMPEKELNRIIVPYNMIKFKAIKFPSKSSFPYTYLVFYFDEMIFGYLFSDKIFLTAHVMYHIRYHNVIVENIDVIYENTENTTEENKKIFWFSLFDKIIFSNQGISIKDLSKTDIIVPYGKIKKINISTKEKEMEIFTEDNIFIFKYKNSMKELLLEKIDDKKIEFK